MGIAKIEVNVSINVSNRTAEQRAVDTALASCGHWLTIHLFKGNVLVPGGPLFKKLYKISGQNSKICLVGSGTLGKRQSIQG